MASLGTLTLDIVAKTGNFTGPLSKAERETIKFSKTLEKLGAEGKTSVDRLQRSFDTLEIKSGLQIEAEKKKAIAAFEAIKNSGVASSKEIQRAYAAMKKQIDDVSPSAKSLISGLGGVQKAALALFAGMGVQQLVTQLYQAGIEAQKLKTTFEAVFGEGLGTKELAFVRAEAQKLGLELLGTSDAYMKLAASAKGTKLEGQSTRDIFSAVAGAGRALALSSDQVHGAFVAIAQIMSKGTVQSEELKGQLSERLPGAFQIAARAVGVTTSELQKMLEMGEIISDDFLPKFAMELQKTFPTSEKAMAGMAAETERLKTAWFELKKTVMEDMGLETVFTHALRALKETLKETKIDLQQLIHPMTSRTAFIEVKPLNKFDSNLLSGANVDQPLFNQLLDPGPKLKPIMTVGADVLQAQEEAAKREESANSRRIANAASLTKSIDSQIASLQLQADTFTKSETSAKLWELQQKGASGPQLKQAEAILKVIESLEKEKDTQGEFDRLRKEGQEDINKNLKAYQSLLRDLRTDEEKYTDTIQERLDIMEKAGVTPDSGMAAKIAASGVTASPTFGGVDAIVGGASGELGKIDQAAQELETWKEAQLEKQDLLQEFVDAESTIFSAAEEQKLKIASEYADKKAALDKIRIKTQEDLNLAAAQGEIAIFESVANSMGEITKNFAGESSAAYKAMFAIQKIFAAAMIIANTEIAASKAQATSGSIFSGAVLAGMIRVAGYASAGMVAGMGLAGMAHDGIDSIPQDGTWLLKKGERVSTAETSAKLDRTLEDVSKQSTGGDAPIINLFEDKSKAGTVETRTQDDRRVIDIWVADLMGDGKAQKAMSRKFGLQPVGA